MGVVLKSLSDLGNQLTCMLLIKHRESGTSAPNLSMMYHNLKVPNAGVDPGIFGVGGGF